MLFVLYVKKDFNTLYGTLSYTIQSTHVSGHRKAWVWESEEFDPGSNIYQMLNLKIIAKLACGSICLLQNEDNTYFQRFHIGKNETYAKCWNFSGIQNSLNKWLHSRTFNINLGPDLFQFNAIPGVYLF